MFQALELILLHRAFDMVCDPEDWKAPIAAEVTLPEVDDGAIIAQAIAHFTATRPTVRLVGQNADGYRLSFTADGYRMGPAGDH